MDAYRLSITCPNQRTLIGICDVCGKSAPTPRISSFLRRFWGGKEHPPPDDPKIVDVHAAFHAWRMEWW